MVGQTIHLSEMDKWRDDDDTESHMMMMMTKTSRSQDFPNTSQDFTRTHKKFYFLFII